jgi:hypothetical protein
MNTVISVLLLVGLLYLDWIYVRWAWLSDQPAADVPARIAIGVVLGLVTVAFLASFLHWILRILKGHLKLSVHDGPYTWGEIIEGNLTLTCRRPLQVERITVTLLGERPQYNSDGDGTTTTTWVPVFESAVDVLGEEPNLRGMHQFAFRLKFPDQGSVSQSEALKKGFDDLEEAVGKTFVGKGFVDIAKSLSSEALEAVPRWKVKAQVNMRGADLFEEVTLRFNSH